MAGCSTSCCASTGGSRGYRSGGALLPFITSKGQPGVGCPCYYLGSMTAKKRHPCWVLPGWGDDIGLDEIIELLSSSWRQANALWAFALDGFESYASKKKRHLRWVLPGWGDDIGLDEIMELPPSSWRQANARRAFAFRWVRVLWHQKKRHPNGCLFFWWTI